MSGIAGLVYRDQRTLEPSLLSHMVARIGHRGPDGSQIWHQGHVGLGHCMLWTTPESLHEQLPGHHPTAPLAITADARIDNRQELYEQLCFQGRSLPEVCDSEIILAAYERWGEDCPQHLIGDFAFAIWDHRQQRLFCARDPMGIKPFYYYVSEDLFVFASEIKSLFCLPEVPRQLEELKIAYLLAGVFEDKTLTAYQNIFRLHPAHALSCLPQGQLQSRAYWSLDPQQSLRLAKPEDYVEAFREIFTESVRCRLRSAYPVGSSLSGGLDSSSIACTARNLLATEGDRPLHTFSAIFPDVPEAQRHLIDERQYMDLVTAQPGIIPHHVEADKLSPLSDYLWQGDEAITAPNAYIHEGLYRSAHSSGVRVFLDGFDGDTTISHGWPYLTEMMLRGQWWSLWKALRAVSQQFKVPRRTLVQKFCQQPILEESRDLLHKLLPLIDQGVSLDLSLMNCQFIQKVGLHQHLHSLLLESWGKSWNSRNSHISGLTTGLYPYAFEGMDLASSTSQLEGRYPFFDRRLIEFCVALPGDQKLRNGWNRYILRAGMEDILPPEIQWRVTKGRLGVNFRQQLLKQHRQTVEAALHQSHALASYGNLALIRDRYRTYSNTLDSASDDDDVPVFFLTVLALWLEQMEAANPLTKRDFCMT